MRPAFGCRIWDRLFEPINANTLGLIGGGPRRAGAVGATHRRDRASPPVRTSERRAVRIDITYRVPSTNDRRNLVYPFYIIPGED